MTFLWLAFIDRRQFEPHAEHRVRGTRLGLQVIPPAFDELRAEVVRLANQERQLFQNNIWAVGELPRKIVGGVSPRELGVLGPFTSAEGVKFAVQLRKLGGECLVGRVLAGRPDHRQLARFMAAREDAIQAVIVVGRNRIELVVVAASATDGQAEQPAADDIDLVVDVVMYIVEFAASGKEPQRRERFGGSVWSKLVGGQLFEHESIVGHIPIEGVDHVIAISIGVRIAAFLGERVALRVRVPRDIQPMPSPAFTVTRRRQQAIDQPRGRVGGFVRDKRVDGIGVERHAEQVEREAPREGSAISDGRKIESRRLERRGDQGVQGGGQARTKPRQFGIGGWDGRTRDRLVGPVGSAIDGRPLHGAQPSGRGRRHRRPWHAHGNPLFQRLDLGGGKFLIGRHFQRTVVTNGREQQTVLRSAGRRDRLTRHPFTMHASRCVQPQVALLLLRSVALPTASRQQRPNPLFEEFFLNGPLGRRGRGRERGDAIGRRDPSDDYGSYRHDLIYQQ